MEADLTPLLPLYEHERAAARAFALAVVVRTRGSTYRKPGALMAIAADGSYVGLLSGGCLENDLAEHARSVIETGQSRTVTYNTGGSDDALWGLGVGCEGAMTILLLRVGPEEDWQPLAYLAQAQADRRPTAVGVVVESSAAQLPIGSVLLQGGTAVRAAGRGGSNGAVRAEGGIGTFGGEAAGGAGEDHARTAAEADALLERVKRAGSPDWLESGGVSLFALPLALPPRLLLLGGGPDASPIVDFGGRLGWKVTVYDHRPSYAKASHFPAADRVVLGRPEALSHTLDLGGFEAAVIMAHHLPSDLEYLRALAASPISYVGLLGPPHRRDRLLADLGPQARGLRERLRAPVGLDLGGRTPESIALSIVAQIHAFLHQHPSPAGDQARMSDQPHG